MQSDDVIWSVINQQFCSYKVKQVLILSHLTHPLLTTQLEPQRRTFVGTNTMSQACAIDNHVHSQTRDMRLYEKKKVRWTFYFGWFYAILTCLKGVLYLYMKTIERAHTPAHMWERIKLSNDYAKALDQVCQPQKLANRWKLIHITKIDKELIYWPNFTVHKCKQRVTKITQYLIKMRRMKLRQLYVPLIPIQYLHELTSTDPRPKLIGVKKKLDRREAARERKALSAAHLERSIEKELIERLKSKAYGDAPLNVNESVWQAILDREKKVQKENLKGGTELELEDDETDEEDLQDDGEMEDEDDWGGKEFVSDLSEEDDELSDLEDAVVRALPLTINSHYSR
jgi:protein MAK16